MRVRVKRAALLVSCSTRRSMRHAACGMRRAACLPPPLLAELAEAVAALAFLGCEGIDSGDDAR